MNAITPRITTSMALSEIIVPNDFMNGTPSDRYNIADRAGSPALGIV